VSHGDVMVGQCDIQDGTKMVNMHQNMLLATTPTLGNEDKTPA